MYNKIILIGNLTKDPELRYTPQGTPVCSFRLASTTRYKSGESMKDDTLFINVVVWGKQGETVAQYLSKGKSVLVDGRLQERRWEADGQQKSRFEVVAQSVRFLGRKDGVSTGEATSDIYNQPDETTDIEPF